MENKLEIIDTFERCDKFREKIDAKNITRTSRKRIAVYYISLGKGGVQRVISLLIPMYIEMGYSVILITDEEKQTSDYEIPDNIIRYVIESTGEVLKKGDYSTRKTQLEKILLDEKIDIVCYHDSMSSLLLNDFLTINHMNIYFVLSKHQVFAYELARNKNLYFTQKEMYRVMDGVVVLSRVEEEYWKKLGINARYIPNPFDNKLKDIKRKNEGYIVWVGRLDLNSKKFMDVIPIMQRVIKRFPNCKLRMYGSAYGGNDQYLLRAIEKAGLQDNIIYCGYTLDVDEIYGGARIQLSVSAYETFPMNIYEGKAYGLPLVTYSMPYLELLSDGKGYISVEQRDVEQAADAIIQILSDEVLEHRLQKEAQESILRFDGKEVMREWDDVFKTLGNGEVACEYEEKFEIVIDTIYSHYETGRRQYAKIAESYEQLWEAYWLQSIKYRVEKDKLEVAIYPYGKNGKRIKRLLNENGIQEKYRVDNYTGEKDSEVVSIEDIRKEEVKKILFVVCSFRGDIYYELRNPLYELTNKENIIDIYPEEKIFNFRV